MNKALTKRSMIHAAAISAAPILCFPLLLIGAAPAHAKVTGVTARAVADREIEVVLKTDAAAGRAPECSIDLDKRPVEEVVVYRTEQTIRISDLSYGDHFVEATCHIDYDGRPPSFFYDFVTLHPPINRPKPAPVDITELPPAAPVPS